MPPQIGPLKNPPGTFTRDDGYHVINEKDGTETFLCGKAEIVDAVRAPDGTRLNYRVRFSDIDGKVSTVAVLAKDLVSDPRAVAAKLADAGMPIGDAPNFALTRLLLHLVRSLPADRRGTQVERPGFHELADGRLAFVTPDGRTIAGSASEGPVLVLSDPAGPQLGGTIEGMKAAAAAAVNTGLDHLAAGLLMGVAGVVVDFAELDWSPIIALVGTTSSGKSTTAQLAASMTGPHAGTGSRFVSLATTLNAVEGRLAAASGTFFAGDETASFPRELLQALIFLISSCEGKGRMKADASLRTVLRWLTFALLTSEVPLRDLMRGPDGREPRAGAAVRAASIDTSGARRLTTVELEALNGFKTNFGHALEPVVRVLLHSIASNSDARAILRRQIAARAADLAGPDAPSLTVRSASVFAVLAVAGQLLREAEITPADFDADALIIRLWTAFQSSADAPADPAETAVKRLTEALYAGRTSHIVPIASLEGEHSRQPLAYFEPRGGQLCFFVPVSNFDKLSGGGAAHGTVAKALRRDGKLEVPGQSGRLSCRRIPGVGEIAHYRILLPTPDAAKVPSSALGSGLNPGFFVPPTNPPRDIGDLGPAGRRQLFQ